jgi:hypothetical protein
LTETVGPEGAAQGTNLRALAAPETIGLVLAVVLVGLLAVSGWLPGAAGPAASEDPGASPSPSAAPSAPGLSTMTRNALLAALGVNQRLTGHVEALEAAIDGDDPTGATIATIVRTLNQDVAVGARAADLIAADPLTAELGADLRTFYAEVASRGRETLDLSIQEGAAHRAAAAELVTILGALPALDDRIADALEGRSVPSSARPSGAPSPSAVASPDPTTPPSAVPSPSPSPATSGEPSATSSTASPGPNLIRNGTFDADLAGWSLQLEPGAVAAATHDPTGGPDGSGAARLDITVGSDARAGISFGSTPFQLERGRRYRVAAMVRSTDARDIRLRVATADGRTTAARAFSIGPGWSVATFEVTELVAGSASVLAVDLGRGESSVWLDDVVVSPSG